ncbi:acyl-homoserine-lactone synthase [Ewingella americana]|uniref:acyl-homoserine-lactone synthase n=1 Tax=Ewingella americana TaxID=41202 RepID=UPI00163B1FDF|nr:acyl-homoserine-lactone synthase [Ewingella americana]QMV52213.1 GNAT family N-acetyltransferase [Ewingella americana]
MSTADIIPLARTLIPLSHQIINKTTPSPSLYGCISGDMENQGFLLSMFNLRHRVFKQRLKWDVSSIDDLEIDQFDNNETQYIITTDINNNVKCCVRLLPTTSPYMLSEIFPYLWQSQQPMPCSDSICELSRFSFEKNADSKNYGFSQSVIRLLRNLVMYAQHNDISRYVFVTTAAIERMLLIQGVSINRIGEVIRIGNTDTTVIFMNINTKTFNALFNHPL